MKHDYFGIYYTDVDTLPYTIRNGMLKLILSQDNSQYDQAPKGREQNPSGLGRAIINRKIKDARKAQESGLVSHDPHYRWNHGLSLCLVHDRYWYVDTTAIRDARARFGRIFEYSAACRSRVYSRFSTTVWSQFRNWLGAERRNVKIIQQSTNSFQNPYLLDEHEEKATIQKHEDNKNRLRVPRRSPWTKSMTSAELDRQEKAAFLDWRRGLAQ